MAKPYLKCWEELSVEQGCLLRGNRVVIPSQGRKEVMELLHEGHQGGTRMKALARSFVWWPGLDGDLESVVKDCDKCQSTRHSPPQAPLHPWEFPAAPWERLHADFAGPFLGQMFLIVVDAYSKWLEVVPMSSATTNTTIERLRTIFATHGLPRVLVTDNGAQFTSSEFRAFTRGNGIKHVYSSPYHPATNGLAERAVQSFKEHMKRLPTGTIPEKLARFLFWYQLTPHSTTGVPPAELLLGRRPRSKLDLLKPNLTETVEAKTAMQMKHHDTHTRARSFQVEDNVYVKDFPNSRNWQPGKIIEIRGPLSYHVELLDGRIVRRHVDAIRDRASDTRYDSVDTDLEIPPPETSETPTISIQEAETSANSDNSERTNQPVTPVPPLRRSTRIRTQPNYLGSQWRGVST